MKPAIWLLTILLAIPCLAQTKAETKEWLQLFNGKNLDGWKMKIAGFPLGENFGNTFRVENGILSIRYDQYGENFNNRFGAINSQAT